MDLQLFIRSLTEKELQDLRKLLNPSGLTINQVMHDTPKMPIRLWNALDVYKEKHPYATELNKIAFLSMKNTGVGTWNELEALMLKKYKTQLK